MSVLQKVALADIIIEAQSGFASGAKDDSGIAQIRMNNVTTDGHLDLTSIRRVPEATVKNLSKYVLKQGDVLFNSTNSANIVGKSALFVAQDEPFVFSNHFVRLVGHPSKVDGSYLARWLTRQQQQGTFELLCTRWVNQAAVRREDLLALAIPLPPLAEQQRIAAILDCADALRAKRRAALAKLDTLLQATFIDMFGDPVTNPKGWMEFAIGSMCDLSRGSSPRPKDDPRFYGGPIPRLMVADLTRDGLFVTPRIDTLTEEGAKKSRHTSQGTVVMAVSGNVGLTAILNIDACIHDGFVAFNNLDRSKILPMYFVYCLHLLKQTHETRKDGAIFQNLTTNSINRMQIPVPDMGKQQAWVQYFGKHLVVKNSYIDGVGLIDNLFHSIQDRVFSGQL